MISDDTLKYISEVFIGDAEEVYSYKKGAELVNFFKQYFGLEHTYNYSLPSRWFIVSDNLKALVNEDRLSDFFTLILSKRYIMREKKISEIEAIETMKKALELFNGQLQYDGYNLIQNDKRFLLINEDRDLSLIGEGGFAHVYLRKSDGKVVKKLKDEYLLDSAVRSRFKREYEITKSIQDIDGIIKLYNFDEEKMLYEMEKGNSTLWENICEKNIERKERFKYVLQLLEIMSKVHERNIIHRDLSPTNILFVNGKMKITDFGLGKSYDAVHSHRTMHTSALGQYDYCSPEQMYSLKDGDKRSDVFSLGRIINFILTDNPRNGRHDLAQLVNKATSQNSEDRYDSATEMLGAFKKIIKIRRKENLKEVVQLSIQKGELTTEVIHYIDSLSGEKLCSELISNTEFKGILINYMRQHSSNETRIIDDIENNFRDVCITFESNDPIATFVSSVIQEDNFNYNTKEKSANILSYIAYSVNRFNAQRIIEGLVSEGIDPLLEEILDR